MVGKSLLHPASPPDSQHQHNRFLDYEHLRNARLEENKKRMQALGLLDLSHSLVTSARRANLNNKNTSSSKRTPRSSPSPTTLTTPPPARRSSRLLGTALPSYKEVGSERDFNDRAVAVDSRQCQPEFYTEEDEKLLGHCSEDWELFKDGYGPNGTRIYDSATGKTCHQCRQKTLGLRTWCSHCESLRGQFCGDCLFMRYGENVLEANRNKNWTCPGCRGICNCSCCRIRKGWAPTGSMYRLASSLDFKSVAHYLIMTRRAPTTETSKKDEIKGCPAEVAEMIVSTESARRALTFDSPPSNAVADNLVVSLKDEASVLDISDTECDDETRRRGADGGTTIGERLRKRPRRQQRAG